MGPKEKIITSVVCVLASASIVYSVSTQDLMMRSYTQGQEARSLSTIDYTKQTDDLLYMDGTYEGEANGFSGVLRVSVTIEGGKIKSIEVLSHSETPEYYEKASAILSEIVSRNGLDVDSVSGATITSDAIKEAVYNALTKAEKPAEKKAAPKTLKPKKSKKTEAKKLENEDREPVYAGNTSVQTGGLKDGTYIGTGRGFNGNIRVRVTVRNHVLTNIEILSHNDDSPYFDQAMSVINTILSGGDGNVSTVTGATYSSHGIIQAVKDALSQAGGATEETPDETTPSSGGQNENQGHAGSGQGGTEEPEDVVVPSDLDQVMIKDVMADGEYVGYAVGYQKAGRIQTTVTVENGEIKSIRVAERRPEYADDVDIFREKAIRITEFMTGENARKIAAVSNLYGRLGSKLFNAGDPYETAKELLGEQYAEPLKGMDPTDTAYYISEEKISGAIKGYLVDKYGVGDMFDAVTGATISSQGVGRSVENAMLKAVNDAKQKNDVKDTVVSAPKDKLIRANKNRNLDLSRLRVTLVKKDDTRVELSPKDFAANHIELIDIDRKTPITDGMSLAQYAAHDLIQVEVRHKISLSNDKFSIELGDYSDDYVDQIHYSLNGKTWYRVKEPVMSQQNPENISYRNQLIDAPESFMYNNVKVRVVSKSGEVYEYETDTLAGASSNILYRVMDARGNSNVPDRLFVNFKFSGTEADKEVVPGGGTKPPDPDGGGTSPDQEIPVNSSVISTDLDYSKDIDYIEGQPIKPIGVSLRDTGAELLHDIENLPKGLRFNGTQIEGSPEVDEDEWDPEYYNGQHKKYEIRIKARKGDKILVKTDEIFIRRDQDKDGFADYLEKDEDQKVFNAQLKDREPIKVDGVAPTMRDYKAKIKNLPEQGVQVVVLDKPKISEVGMTQVKLGFKVAGLDKVGEIVIPVNVTKPATEVPEPEIPDPELDKEIPVNSSVISTDLDYSKDIDYIEGQPIKPIGVSLRDTGAELLHDIENLPKGLRFNGTQIEGSPEVDEGEWDPEYYNGQHKKYEIRIKARKGDKILVKTDEIIIRRDQDKDGFADYLEKDEDQKVFNAQLKDREPIIVQGKAPTLEDYKAKIKNLPKNGVTVDILKEPDLSKAGDTTVKLGFHVEGLTAVGEKEIQIKVEKPVEKQVPAQQADVPKTEKAETDSKQEMPVA